MERDDLRAGLRKLADILLRVRDHEVHVKRKVAQRTQCLDDIRAKADVRHEMTVHNIEVQPIGRADGFCALAHAGKIACEHRRCNFHFYHFFLREEIYGFCG